MIGSVIDSGLAEMDGRISVRRVGIGRVRVCV
jgi:hypothetical protein